VTEFLLELYFSRSDAAAVELGALRAREAAEELRLEGVAVRYVRSIYIPEDETCFLVYEANTSDAVRRAASRASLSSGRILAAEAGQQST
jgi:uncharacterized protein DUF4242